MGLDLLTLTNWLEIGLALLGFHHFDLVKGVVVFLVDLSVLQVRVERFATLGV